ncbi:AMP-binding protein [Wenzhouxiangella marina]|uniref:Peptide synthase n=1 Tax=Wenzhouxiangella marina TaxID=1579979 RepID=A0A0K0Y0G8_9GAMM|nr:AMP-binding protein [Wenzhouxiangella marina]AKS43361.1 Peptide synthase [Wenzhouxiangella marina]MBB6088524.1 acyl-coenzyme A synthetase/AMP-(fatty) acid ligase [Wenzhouxiangella marina]
MSDLPLIERALDDVLLHLHDQELSVAAYLGRAMALSAQLPPRTPVVNLCQNRGHFSIGFAAVLLAGGHNLLPANRLPATIDALLEQHPGACVLADCAMDRLSVPVIHPADVDSSSLADRIPSIPAHQLAAVVFTSGSTGASSRILKPWATLYHSARLNQASFGPRHPVHALATVPPQHMWGLETSVLLPWFAPITMHDAQPFFAADIVASLQQLPEPRVLISAPVHLRVLDEADSELPKLETIYSATAPLSPKLAQRLESGTGSEVREIYGCSETGCLAQRRSARGEGWTPFAGFEFDGGPRRFRVRADHLPETVELMDELAFDAQGRFELIGRSSDLVNVAGKRASLAELTRILLDIPGVVDGVIFQPPAQREGRVERLAALVVAPGLDAASLRARLAERIDAAFLPRPLRLVEALPRAESGKLPQHALMDFFRQHAEPARA